MIIDSIQHIEKYLGLSRNLDTAIAYILRMDKSDRANGSFEIDGRNVYVNKGVTNLHPADEGKFEAHRRYIDIQLVLEGVERMDAAPVESLGEPIHSYELEGDYALYAPCANCVSACLHPGQFAIFFPQDAHMPCLAAGEGATSYKAIVKVAV